MPRRRRRRASPPPCAAAAAAATDGDAATAEAARVVAIPPEAVALAIGAGGRNVSLVGKHTGAFLRIQPDGEVHILRRPDAAGEGEYRPELAERLVLSVVAGGVLRWFSNPHATATRFPEAGRAELCAWAREEFGCALELLRARSGHMCLLLVPLTAAAVTAVPAARAAVLARLPAAAPAA